MDPKHFSAHFDRGRAYTRLGNYEMGIRDFDGAMINPRSPEAFTNRGNAYEHLGNHEQKINDWKTAAKMGLGEAQEYLREQGIPW